MMPAAKALVTAMWQFAGTAEPFFHNAASSDNASSYADQKQYRDIPVQQILDTFSLCKSFLLPWMREAGSIKVQNG